MADNYLEKRMEDLRQGRLGSAAGRSTRHKAGAAPGRMAGLRVVVTGGARGIGREIVRQFRASGASVDILDTDRRNGTATAQEYGARFHPVDIADTKAFDECIASIIADRGDIDVIVNDAARVDFTPLEENSAERLMESMAVNVVPVLEGARLLALHRRGLPSPNPYGGRIINICSTRAAMSEAGTENYSATKGAVASLTHALMMSMAPYRVTVNSISPGWIVTDPEEKLTEADHSQHPSGRAGTPADIARICLFLAEKGNDFINGENITSDGGMTHRMIYV